MRRIREHVLSYLLILPAAFVMIVFVFRPIWYSLVLSAQTYRLGFKTREFVALRNYRDLFLSSDFWNSLGNTAAYSIAMVVLSLLAGLLLALAVVNARKASTLWQAIFFLPVTATMAAMAIVWRFILDDNFGIVNAVLVAMNQPTIDFLRNPQTAMGSVIFISVWSNAGYAMIFFYAGMMNIPESLYQSAALDGSSRLQDFRYITWPLVSPTTLFMLIIMTKRALASFDTIKVMTNGGPVGATEVLSLLLYQEAFQFFNIGYASALSIVFFIIVLFLALFQMRLDRRVFYQ